MRPVTSPGVVCAFTASAVLAQTVAPRDWSIHPRGEKFQPELHYKGAAGEIYYHAENDVQGRLSDFKVEGTRPLVPSIGVGPQIFARASRGRGTVRPVFLWDSNGDRTIDRSLAGRIEGARAVYEAPLELDLAALARADTLDATEAGTSTGDNLRLYAKEVHPRSAKQRSTSIG